LKKRNKNGRGDRFLAGPSRQLWSSCLWGGGGMQICARVVVRYRHTLPDPLAFAHFPTTQAHNHEVRTCVKRWKERKAWAFLIKLDPPTT
jgi:hypothetical protein